MKSGSKRKGEPGTPDCDSPLFLPYETLISIVGSMAFNEREAQLVEILSEKTGVRTPGIKPLRRVTL